MSFEYLFKEFDPEIDAGDIREWLAKLGDEGWEAVGFATKTHVTGGGIIGGIAIPSSQRFGYTFLLKRPKANPPGIEQP
jgi:hypothetical protein